jgi:hypothetical protein
MNSMEVLGQVLTAEGHYPEADRILRESYDTRLRVLGRDHHDTAGSVYDLGALYAAEGKKEEAIAMLKAPSTTGCYPRRISIWPRIPCSNHSRGILHSMRW